MGLFAPGDHGSTFGGNPLGCAVAREALRVIIEEKLCERSAELGTYFMRKLAELRSPLVHELRGKGLWIGLELNQPARPFCERLMKLGCSARRRTSALFALRRRSSSGGKRSTGP